MALAGVAARWSVPQPSCRGLLLSMVAAAGLGEEMTPLAQHLLNDWCKPKAQRRVADPCDALRFMPDAKCFDTSRLTTAGVPPPPKGAFGQKDFEDRVFLPAPVTFLDWGHIGCLLLQTPYPGGRDAFIACTANREGVQPIATAFKGADERLKWAHLDAKEPVFSVPELQRKSDIQVVFATLFLLSVPHLVDLRVHQPHAGLQRKVAQAKGQVGRYPLQAWSEVTIFASADPLIDDRRDAEIESHLSGQKCLHFVRSFLRWRRGQLERVKAHWRGDPALGMKRTRYVAELADKVAA
jgi:hypothetical protein